MSERMLKYQVSSDTSRQVAVLMREGATIRAVGVQGHAIYVWAETPVQADPLTITRTFRVVATGDDLPGVGNYIGTVFEGPYVWHIYEVPS
jgi:hypothetical protein